MEGCGRGKFSERLGGALYVSAHPHGSQNNHEEMVVFLRWTVTVMSAIGTWYHVLPVLFGIFFHTTNYTGISILSLS
jgi:hypothetical protein